MQKNNSVKTKLGFTMIELLIVIGIMVILFAVSTPAVKAIKTKLSWTKANGVAKEIFMVAENQAIHLRSNNALGGFYSEVKKKNNQVVVTKPSDYTKNNAKYKNLYYISNTDSGAMSYIIPNLTQQSIVGSYLIEVNPKSGNVYGVFYSETLTTAQLIAAYEKGTKTSSGGALASDQFRASEYRKNYTLGDDKHMIGYYGGSEAGLSGDDSQDVTIHAYNREQLYVKVNVPHAKFDRMSDENFSIDFIISDEHGNKIVRSGKSNVYADWNKPIFKRASDGSIDAYLIMDDSINSTAHTFTSLNKGLTAGDDITITAQTAYIYEDAVSGSKKYITTQLNSATGSVTVNSLFGDGTSISDDPSKATVIKVSNCRQLRNLSTFRNDNTWALNNRKIRTEQLVTVDQTKDIDFSKLKSSDTSASQVCPAMGSNGLSFKAPSTFGNLENKFVFGYASSTSSSTYWPTGDGGDGYSYSNPNNTYNGNGNEIQNLVVYSYSNTGSGLFGKFNSRLIGVHVRNIKVSATKDKSRSYIGGLVGWAGPKTYIKDCGVYCSAYKEKSSFPYDSSLGAFSYDNYYIEGARDVGGLVGRMETEKIDGTYISGSIISSFSAIDVKVVDVSSLKRSIIEDDKQAYSSIGGIVGRTVLKDGHCPATIKNCYSSGKITATFDSGGIAGVTAATIENCYSTSTIKLIHKYNDAAYSGGGITGKLMNPGIVRNCQFYGTFEASDSKVVWKSQNVGVIADEKRASGQAGRTVTGCKYLAQGVNNKLRPTEDITKDEGAYYGAAKTKYTELANEGNLSATNSYPYNSKLDGKAFPFKSTIGYHYGDWPEKIDEDLKSALVYYEKYSNGKYGFWVYDSGYDDLLDSYGVGLKSSSNIGSLTIQETGYAAIIDDEDSIPTGVNKTAVYKNSELGCGIYKLTNQTKSSYSSAFYDNSIKLGDTTFYYNPEMAKAISDDNSTPSNAYIRTAKQLNNLSAKTLYWKIKSIQTTYKQELDIDSSSYSGSDNTPIGNGSTSFENNYDGLGNDIVGFNLSKTASGSNMYFGLFGKVGGDSQTASIQNVHLVAAGSKTIAVSYSSIQSCATGGLVGYLTEGGSVRNCSVSGYTISANITGNNAQAGKTAVGGLVGTSYGDIYYCSAVNDSVAINTTSLKLSIGGSTGLAAASGLVGTKRDGNLYYSYAGGKIAINMQSKNGDFYDDAYVAGICAGSVDVPGVLAGDNYAYYCYSYCSFSKPSGSGDNYEIAGSTQLGDNDTCMYLTDIAKNVTKTSGVQKTSAEFASETADSDKPTAEYTFPSDPNITGQYPFKAYVRAGRGGSSDPLVHYGDWPGASGSSAEKLDQEAPNPPTPKTITADTIVLNDITSPYGTTVEYAISTDDTLPSTGWQTSTTFEGLDPETDYYFFARYQGGKVGDVEYNQSPASDPAKITTDDAKKDQNAPDAPTAKSVSDKTIVLNTITSPYGTTVEYARSTSNSAPTDDGDWQTSTTFEGLTPGTDYYFFARYKGGKVGDVVYNQSPPSEGRMITTKKTQNAPDAPTLALRGTNFIVINPITSPYGTTVKYAINTTNTAPTDDNAWKEQLSYSELEVGTNYYFFARYEGNSEYVQSQPSQGRRIRTVATQAAPNKPTLVSKTSTSVTLSEASGGGDAYGNHTNPKYGYSLFDSAATATWVDEPTITGLLPGTNYFFFVRYPAGEMNEDAYLMSEASGSTKIKTKTKQNAPSKPQLDSKTSTSISLKPITGGNTTVMYAMCTSSSATPAAKDWTKETTFTGLTAGTTYYFYAMYPETGEYEASGISDRTDITTKKTQTKPSKLTSTDIAYTSITVSVASGGGASDGTHSEPQYACCTKSSDTPTEWGKDRTFDGLTAGTTYYFYARYCEDDDYEVSPYSQVATFTTKSSPKAKGYFGIVTTYTAFGTSYAIINGYSINIDSSDDTLKKLSSSAYKKNNATLQTILGSMTGLDFDAKLVNPNVYIFWNVNTDSGLWEYVRTLMGSDKISISGKGNSEIAVVYSIDFYYLGTKLVNISTIS